MNASLQCLSNTKELTDYFLNNYKEKDKFQQIMSHEYYIDKLDDKTCKIDILYDKIWQELIDLLLKKDYHDRPTIDDVYNKYILKKDIDLVLLLKINYEKEKMKQIKEKEDEIKKKESEFKKLKKLYLKEKFKFAKDKKSFDTLFLKIKANLIIINI